MYLPLLVLLDGENTFPNFFEASKVDSSKVEEVRVTSETVSSNGDMTRMYSVQYKTDATGKLQMDTWLQLYKTATNKWSINKLSTRFSRGDSVKGSGTQETRLFTLVCLIC